MATRDRLELLQELYPDEAELNRILDKLLDAAQSENRRRLERYQRDLEEFEKRHGLDSATFYRRFQAGELGDAMDFFEWAGLYELAQDLRQKLARLE
jgi:hypothetical protein